MNILPHVLSSFDLLVSCLLIPHSCFSCGLSFRAAIFLDSTRNSGHLRNSLTSMPSRSTSNLGSAFATSFVSCIWHRVMPTPYVCVVLHSHEYIPLPPDDPQLIGFDLDRTTTSNPCPSKYWITRSVAPYTTTLGFAGWKSGGKRFLRHIGHVSFYR